MLTTEKYPILEYDDDRGSKVDPTFFVREKFDTDKLVITFFGEVVEKMKKEGKLRPYRTIPGECPIDVYAFTETPDVLLVQGQIGCPACAGNLDLFYAFGARKVTFCGGGGVLDPDIKPGEILLVDEAIRDEGFSYQYLPASRTVPANETVNAKIADYLDKQGVPYLRGTVWTTDAIFRETEARIRRRAEEGAKIVEMEQAGCMAVAACRGFSYGALIYGGDDVSGAEWDQRNWRSHNGIRYDMVELCRKLTACL